MGRRVRIFLQGVGVALCTIGQKQVRISKKGWNVFESIHPAQLWIARFFFDVRLLKSGRVIFVLRDYRAMVKGGKRYVQRQLQRGGIST